MRKETTIDRILLVLDPAGSLRAAHQERMERYLDDDGQVVTERYLQAEPVSTEALAGLIGASAAQWSLECLTLQSRVAGLETRLAAETERSGELARQLDEALAAASTRAPQPEVQS